MGTVLKEDGRVNLENQKRPARISLGLATTADHPNDAFH